MNISTRSLLGLILTIVVGYLALQVIHESNIRQEIVIENAEVKNIKYGLLSVHSWKGQVSDILAKKIQEFELTTENRRELQASIQNGMYQLLDQLESLLEEKRTEGRLWEVAVKTFIQSFFIDINDIRRNVPEFTEIILNELDNYETREKLRIFLQKKVDELLYETVGEEDLSNIEFIAGKNGCSNIIDCSDLLQSKLEKADEELRQNSMMIIGIAALVFIIILFGNKEIILQEYIVLILLCGVLLYTGITTPMIDIDARIDNFRFILLGEPLEFSDQILFFQSKSIFEVVEILISTGEYQSILVGGLIFLFSIIFPISKLIASVGILTNENLYNNRVVNFLALKSGKWSMADVVVVAIFMSYIGFRGIIENQLNQLEGISEKVEILTTDNSNFGVGFILFLAFCIGGLILATIVERRGSSLMPDNA